VLKFVCEENSRVDAWPPWEEFVTSTRQTKLCFKLRPGLGNSGLETSVALDLLREQVHFLARYVMQHTLAVDWRYASLLPSEGKGTTKSSRLFLAPLTFATRKESAVHRAVWVVRPSVLEQALQQKAWSTIFQLGVSSYVVGTPSMARVYILRPALVVLPSGLGTLTPIDEGGEEVIVLFFCDLHREAFVYNACSSIVKHCRVSADELGVLRAVPQGASEVLGRRECASLRSWLGLPVRASDCAHC
jgi:hypothetical protein